MFFVKLLLTSINHGANIQLSTNVKYLMFALTAVVTITQQQDYIQLSGGIYNEIIKT